MGEAMLNDLTTITNVREWMEVNQNNATINTLIAREITRVSSVLLAWLNKDTLLSKSFTETLDGYSKDFIILKKFPVTAITSLTIGQTVVPLDTNAPFGPGYYLEPWDGYPPGRPQMLKLNGISQALNHAGFTFPPQRQSVFITYTAGYLQQNEQQTVANGAVTPNATYGLWAADVSVSYADGSGTLTAVAGSPAAGQYVPPNPFSVNPTTNYTFNTADNGKAVLLNYSYIPAAVEGAVCEMVAERLSYRNRIGQKSKTLGGQETASYQLTDLPDYVKASLQSYRNVLSL